LSVIIDAIKESRKIFQRMNSYAMYRIAETLRVLLFMTLAIVIFNFYPLTAIMIVMLALLNDGAILSIAYDNVIYRNQPEAWNMRVVLGIATVLGLVGPIAAFGLFYLGDRVFHVDRPQIQTMMYLMLSVAGHLTIFQTRTRGPWWSIRPAWILLAAIVGTQAAATAICVFGFLVTPLWWGWAAFVWGYALIWFLLTDPVKVLAYRVLDATGAVPPSLAKAGSRRGATAELKPEAKAEPPDDAKAESNPDNKAASTPDARTGALPGAEAAPKSEAKPNAKVESKAATDVQPRPAAQNVPKSKGKAESEAATKTAITTDAEAQPEANSSAATLLNRTLGDLLVAGLIKDPEDAGRIIAAAIAQTQPPIAARNALEAQVKSEAEAKTPPAPTPKAAE
jgi:H+-transporting ATPase